jgi:spore maturation protein CgeB
MKIVIFGLTISSSWGNGHATLWRGLCRALARPGHRIVFFERDVPYYASHRDLPRLADGSLILYPDWQSVLAEAERQLSDADAALVTSYCPDAIAASELLLSSPAKLRVFYDLDTPVTLSLLQSGQGVPYVSPQGLQDFDLVLSYTGGLALQQLKTELGARFVAPLYGSVDPEIHCPVPSAEVYRSDLSYLGTYAEDRQTVLDRFFIQPARLLPHKKFLIGGALYPEKFPWTQNIFFARHVAPGEHPAFYCSSRLTLNITRGVMAAMGYCPSGRLFEAAACGAAILSDNWPGLDNFFQPGSEIILAQTTEDAMNALQLSDAELKAVAAAARQRTLEQHTANHRAIELENAFEAALQPQPQYVDCDETGGLQITN